MRKPLEPLLAVVEVPLELGLRLVSCLKVIGGMKVFQRHVAQTGRTSITVADRAVDVRLTCDYVYRSGSCDDDWPNMMIAADDVGDRHNEGANYLSVDGHTKWIRLYEDRYLQELRTKHRGFDKYRGLDEIQALRGESVPQPSGEQPPGIPGFMPGFPPGGSGPPPPGRPGP